MNCNLTRSITFKICFAIFSSLILPSFAACDGQLADCPEAPAPTVESYTEIEGALNKYAEKVYQRCSNPPHSESWSGEDWARYFDVEILFMRDLDLKTSQNYVRGTNEKGNQAWLLKDDRTEEIEDWVEAAWTGKVDLTTPGNYVLKCSFFNPDLPRDQAKLRKTAKDKPLIIDCVIIVKETPPRQDIMAVPTPGSTSWAYHAPATLLKPGFNETGTLEWSYCYKLLRSRSSDCGGVAVISSTEETAVLSHPDPSPEIKALAKAVGARLQTRESVHLRFGPCQGDNDIYRNRYRYKVNLYQRVVKVTRRVTREWSSILLVHPKRQELTVVDYLYEDTSQLQAACEHFVTKESPDPDCLCDF